MLIGFTPYLFTFLYFLTFYETQYGNLGELDWIPSPSLFSCVTRSRVWHILTIKQMLLFVWFFFHNTYHSDGHTLEEQNTVSENSAIGSSQEDTSISISPTCEISVMSVVWMIQERIGSRKI